MIRNFTPTDLIRYAYNETELHETVFIQHGIDADPVIRDEYNEVLETIDLLDKIAEEPSAESLLKIMSYSRSVSYS